MWMVLSVLVTGTTQKNSPLNYLVGCKVLAQMLGIIIMKASHLYFPLEVLFKPDVFCTWFVFKWYSFCFLCYFIVFVISAPIPSHPYASIYCCQFWCWNPQCFVIINQTSPPCQKCSNTVTWWWYTMTIIITIIHMTLL